ncbi:MAG TPA: UDP-N-acetylmuramoyl-tripeptide--D-alanyl-D-alanine ligase [Solirubrobacteraceae bacterium]|jgi:UDP-N-acetylmuramoyl-tripeptide--D-alanyl-D-alanine ligase|nr:UDP-N-acetylmuramoyl-tripeptide--D-alanyl-D-alanine ligase [Solirubrobacteraceae bacterium]
MKDWDARRVADAAGATLVRDAAGGPTGVTIDSRAVSPGDLFVGLVGDHADGGTFAAAALAAGAWGVLVRSGSSSTWSTVGRLPSTGAPSTGRSSTRPAPTATRQPPTGAGPAPTGTRPPPTSARPLLTPTGPQAGEPAGYAETGEPADPADPAVAEAGGAILEMDDPLAGLQALARAWRRELGRTGARVVAITGSTGKTSTKDILRGLLSPVLATVASPLNHNTEIGLPLAVLAAPAGTQAVVLELAMRGPGQIRLLASICEPEVAVIVNVGPAHLELLGSLEAIAAAKAELLEGLAAGATAVIPAGEPALDPYLRDDIDLVLFGRDGDVSLVRADAAGVEIDLRGERIELDPGFRSPHQLGNLLAAVGAADALGVRRHGPVDVAFSAGRGEHRLLASGVVVVDDCYNANPMSMRAALEDLRLTASGRRVAVLGDMLELGPDERRFHSELGDQATGAGVDLLVTVGARAVWAGERFSSEHRHVDDAGAAAVLVPGLVRPGDTVLIKGSRGVGLEAVTRALAAN